MGRGLRTSRADGEVEQLELRVERRTERADRGFRHGAAVEVDTPRPSATTYLGADLAEGAWMRRGFGSLSVAVAVWLCGNGGSAAAGTIVLSGDVTPAVSVSSFEGNSQFFRNLLGVGSDVAVLPTANVPAASNNLVTFYSGLSGVSVSELSGSLTAASLQSVDLLLLPFPDDAFSAAEIAAVSGFLGAGGTLFVTGESSSTLGNPSGNASVNALLTGLASGLALVSANLDVGSQLATGDQILADPLTAGVSSLAYGSTSIVSGGTPLFRTTGGETFMAYVPEPASAWLLAGGLAALAARRRRAP